MMKTVYYNQHEYERAKKTGAELELFESTAAVHACPRYCEEFILTLWNNRDHGKNLDYIGNIVSVTITQVDAVTKKYSRTQNSTTARLSHETWGAARQLFGDEMWAFMQKIINTGTKDAKKNFKNIADYCVNVSKKLDNLTKTVDPHLSLSPEDLKYLIDRIEKQCKQTRPAKEILAYIKEIGVLDKHFSKKSLGINDIEKICANITERYELTQELSEISSNISQFIDFHQNKKDSPAFLVDRKHDHLVPKINVSTAKLNIKNSRVVKNIELLEAGDRNIMLKNYGCLKFRTQGKEFGYVINDLTRLKVRDNGRD